MAAHLAAVIGSVLRCSLQGKKNGPEGRKKRDKKEVTLVCTPGFCTAEGYFAEFLISNILVTSLSADCDRVISGPISQAALFEIDFRYSRKRDCSAPERSLSMIPGLRGPYASHEVRASLPVHWTHPFFCLHYSKGKALCPVASLAKIHKADLWKTTVLCKIARKLLQKPLTNPRPRRMINPLGIVKAAAAKKVGKALDNPQPFCYYSNAHGGIAQLGARLKR